MQIIPLPPQDFADALASIDAGDHQFQVRIGGRWHDASLAQADGADFEIRFDFSAGPITVSSTELRCGWDDDYRAI